MLKSRHLEEQRRTVLEQRKREEGNFEQMSLLLKDVSIQKLMKFGDSSLYSSAVASVTQLSDPK